VIVLAMEIVFIATASQIYVQLFDNPSCARDVLSTGKNSVFDDLDKTMSRTQVCQQKRRRRRRKGPKGHSRSKRSRKKVRYETLRVVILSNLVAAAIAAASTNEDKGLDLTPQKDDDPDGIKLLTSPEPLERAWKLLSPLLRLPTSSINVWISVYDVAVRRGVLNGTKIPPCSELLYPREVLASRSGAQSRESSQCRSSRVARLHSPLPEIMSVVRLYERALLIALLR
jgi:NMDA receptor-regulated protein 1